MQAEDIALDPPECRPTWRPDPVTLTDREALAGAREALLETGYGLTLLAKIGAVACLLAAAAANKLRFVPAVRAGDRRGAAALRRSIAVEWAAICLVLLATTALTSLQGAPWESSP